VGRLPLHRLRGALTPSTSEARAARRWLEGDGGQPIDGVVAKRLDLPYAPGRRAMVKVKRERTATASWRDPREMALDFTPLSPVRVAEVAYDRMDDLRFRHAARFVRWRPDREARSCGFDQLAAVPLR
jgi:ATP-dependent DNA ligase